MRAVYNIDIDDLRAVCIRNGFYTRGDNRAYTNMFELCRGDDLETIQAVAEDIIAHSADHYETTDVMETIINNCVYITIEEGPA